MGGHMVLYRGSLKSCNYKCSYCPFSKHAMSQEELVKDRRQWNLFVSTYLKQAENLNLRALMLVPYGEALIHPWYWTGLAGISASAGTDAVGAQTNLGFSVKEALDDFRNAGGLTRKLRLWATFHPQMTTVSEFAEKCMVCMEAGVTVCAGAVGVPEHEGLLHQLREELPEEIYLWINKMDGLKRPYTQKERESFADIDPYFFRELTEHAADVSQCQERIFLDGSGRLGFCNISSTIHAGLDTYALQSGFASCKRKRCSCYLAYGGRENLLNQLLFGPYPLFRIPRRPKAVFLDIEGTLLPKKSAGSSLYKKEESGSGISKEWITGLTVLAEREKSLLFLATTLPYEDARKRLQSIWHLFAGGVFAGGAHILWKGVSEQIYFLKEADTCLKYLKPFEKQFHFRILTYKKCGRCYKITLLRAGRKLWSGEEADQLINQMPGPVRRQVRYVTEENCLQILAAGTGKAAGVRLLCSRGGISLKEVFAAGDSAQDEEMVKMCMGGFHFGM